MAKLARKRGVAPIPGDVRDPRSFAVLGRGFVQAMEVRNFSPRTIAVRHVLLRGFVEWCHEREIRRPMDVTKPILERYQRWLYQRRRKNGQALSFRTQHSVLSVVKAFFRWLAKENYLLWNPASEIELPRTPKRLPVVMTLAEVEAVLSAPDVMTPLGVRDRALMEVLYSTGMRRLELGSLGIYDLDVAAGTVLVRQGKGQKDRMIPIGERALGWVDKYLMDVRPKVVVEPDDGRLFLTTTGEPFHPNHLSSLVRDYVIAAAIGKAGGCHLFRHTMATLMLEHGADIRFIQEMLGHARLDTTEIYTHVSIRKLKEIHEATHPGARAERFKLETEATAEVNAATRDELLTSLAAESDEDGGDGEEKEEDDV